MNEENMKKLEALNNPKVMKLVKEYVELCKPEKMTVITDSKEDIGHVRNLAVTNGEEKPLKIKGHTIHFDGYYDQARDKANTKVLLSGNLCLSKCINCGDREKGIKEVLEFLDGSMEGKEMLVRFFCLGPLNSKFSIPALQITDSAYVAHSEDLLYRSGYEEFKRLNGSEDFFFFTHSAGEPDEKGNSKNTDKRRIYIDLEEEKVLSVNNEYAGNSIGLKKLALRLAISKANREDWLCEHMFVMGVHPKDKDRVTYFTGAFPSACGKTSTAMISGQTIIGDDIAYIRPGEDGTAYAVNVESGMFGIIQDVNPEDDPVIYKVLTTPRELIFSNVLIKEDVPYWLGMGKELPKEGHNFLGEWKEGKKGPDEKEVPPAHKNARYTIRINELDNADEKADDPNGVSVGGFIYGGRDSDISVPVFQSLSWSHGVYVGACLESETTYAAIGKEGDRVHNPMANLDFLVIPLGVYIQNHLKFGESLDKPPLIFKTNYFLKNKDGKFLNGMEDKKIWLLWMEGRVHNEFDAIETPIGYIPKYEDLKKLFEDVFNREYTREEYEEQFKIRTQKLLDKINRLENIFTNEMDIPSAFLKHMDQEKERLEEAKKKE